MMVAQNLTQESTAVLKIHIEDNILIKSYPSKARVRYPVEFLTDAGLQTQRIFIYTNKGF